MVWGGEDYVLCGDRSGDLLSPSPWQLVGDRLDRGWMGLLGGESHGGVAVTRVTVVVSVVIRRGRRRLRRLQECEGRE